MLGDRGSPVYFPVRYANAAHLVLLSKDPGFCGVTNDQVIGREPLDICPRSAPLSYSSKAMVSVSHENIAAAGIVTVTRSERTWSKSQPDQAAAVASCQACAASALN
jgi:hypothetical protein